MPSYNKPGASSSKNGHKPANGQMPKAIQRSSNNHQKPRIINKELKAKDENATADEFEQFLQNANRKSDEMRDDVEAYLRTTDDVNADNGVVTSQPNNITSDGNNLAPQLRHQHPTNSLLD